MSAQCMFIAAAHLHLAGLASVSHAGGGFRRRRRRRHHCVLGLCVGLSVYGGMLAWARSCLGNGKQRIIAKIQSLSQFSFSYFLIS